MITVPINVDINKITEGADRGMIEVKVWAMWLAKRIVPAHTGRADGDYSGHIRENVEEMKREVVQHLQPQNELDAAFESFRRVMLEPQVTMETKLMALRALRDRIEIRPGK